jgi:stage III sporulation protein SpoIIIAA
MIWKLIDNYNYSINENGEVRNNKSGRILRAAPDGDGYMRVALCKGGKQNTLKIHRLLGIYFLNCPLHKQIDHIDGDRQNNNLSNLRVVTCQHNQWNRKDAKGYTWNSQVNKWQAQICVNRKSQNLGYYAIEEDARAAYLKAKATLHQIP